jgi:Phage integrase family
LQGVWHCLTMQSEAKIKYFTWHCLRHTFASRLVMAGVDLRTVADLMGHQKIQTTMMYVHLTPAQKARRSRGSAFNALERTRQEADEAVIFRTCLRIQLTPLVTPE